MCKMAELKPLAGTLVTTEMTTGVIAGYKSYTSTRANIAPIHTPIYTATLSDSDTINIRDLINRISALERIQPSQLYKVENCPNCGGSMKLYAEEHILKCPYCKSVCFVDIKNING